MSEVLICGYGNIGRHMFLEICDLIKYNIPIVIYDKYDTLYNNKDCLNREYDFAFVCVPTDNIEERCDTSIVEEVLEQIKAKIIVIKSTVPVGFCDKLNKDNIVFSPEYWGTTIHSDETQDFTILGGDPKLTHKVAQLLSRIKNGNHRFIFTNYKTAELAKYMENSWIATKVTFCNEFANAAKQYGVEYEDLRNCFVADKRVSPSHTYVFEDQPYYDSHCLNKDIPALLTQCADDNIHMPLMNRVKSINLSHKQRGN